VSVTSPAAAPSGFSTVVAGQARGVLALWYATRGLSADDASRLIAPDDSNAATPAERGDIWPSFCRDERPLQWSERDLEAARSLLALPATQVNDVLARDWQHWTRPDTPTDALLEALGLPPVGPPGTVEPLPTTGC
jgi:hypothetical protein